jgi:hypothetical protein
MTDIVLAGLVIVTAMLTFIIVALLRSHAEILRALHDLGVTLDPFEQPGRAAPRVHLGVPAPRSSSSSKGSDIQGVGPTGGSVSVAVVGVPRRTLLAFLTTGCLTCRSFWESLGRSADLTSARIVIVTKDGGEESESAVRELAPEAIPVVMSSSAWDAYSVEVAPYFVLVDGASGSVMGEGAASSWDQVQRLLEQALADATVGTRRLAAEDALREAGIGPGDPSLRPPLEPSRPDTSSEAMS